MKRQIETGLRARSDDPATKAADALTAHFNTYPKGDARYTETSAELLAEVEAATLADVKKWYSDVFATDKGEIALVGDFEPESARRALESAVAGKKTATTPYERIVREFKPVAPARLVIDTPEKENAVLLARLAFPANASDKDRAALTLANWILGGGSGLSNRIVTRLRQKEGLSYGAGAALKLPDFGNDANWTIQAIVAPQNLKQAETSLKDELARARRDGVTPAELEEAKRGMLEYRAVNRAQDATLAASWTRYLDLGLDFSDSAAFEKEIEALTLADVNAAVKRLADPAQMTFVLAGDRKKAREAGKDFE